MLLVAGAAMVASAQPTVSVGNLPLWFEESQPQAGSDAAFVAHTRGAEFLISPQGASFALRNSEGESAQVRMQFVGANANPTISAEGELAAKVNYLLGNRPSQWRSELSTFARVKVENLYPGVNVVYYGNQKELEYDLNLAAGVNPQTIAIRFDGAEHLSIDAKGQLVVKVSDGTVYQHSPVIYQVRNGLRVALTGGYRILDGQTVAFNVENYDPNLPLVIDPVLGYSTYFGGNGGEILNGMTVAADGSVYIVGSTLSSIFSNTIPTSVFQTNFHGGTITGDAFVARFNPSGGLVFLTLLGGSADDGASAVALDAQSNIVVVGFTDSTNFPTANVVGGLTSKLSGTNVPGLKGVYLTDVFVAKLSPDGSTLLNSGYLGGNQSESAQTLAIDPTTGNVFLAGYTYSTNYPTTPGAYQPTLHCTNSFYYNFNGFISVISLSPSSSNLVYSTFLGGTNADVIRGIAITNNNLFVTGYTASTNEYGTNFPSQTFVYAYQMGATNIVVTNQTQPYIMNGTNSWAGILWSNTISPDAFVAAFQISAGDTNLTPLYSGYIGGSSKDYAYAIAVDGNNSAYIVGSTLSTNFPYHVPIPPSTFVTNLSFATTNGPLYIPTTNAFLTQILWNSNSMTASVGYSIVFGQQGVDTAYSLALGTNGNIFVIGSSTSTNFPVTTNNIYGSLRATNSSWNPNGLYGSDAFVACFNTTSALPVFSAYLGGSGDDFGYAIAVDPVGNVYVAGVTYSTNFPTFNASDSYLSGSNDVFVAKILPAWSTPSLSLASSKTNLDISWAPVGQGGTSAFYLESTTNLTTTNWMTISNVVVSTNGVVNYDASPTNPAQFFRLHQY